MMVLLLLLLLRMPVIVRAAPGTTMLLLLLLLLRLVQVKVSLVELLLLLLLLLLSTATPGGIGRPAVDVAGVAGSVGHGKSLRRFMAKMISMLKWGWRGETPLLPQRVKCALLSCVSQLFFNFVSPLKFPLFNSSDTVP
jgi:hypothetical protein